jgi:hypothetical protein
MLGALTSLDPNYDPDAPAARQIYLNIYEHAVYPGLVLSGHWEEAHENFERMCEEIEDQFL